MGRRLRAGDWVRVRPAREIMATLDERGCLEGMPFMPEMLAFVGQRLRVSARAHKTCDTVNQTGGRHLRNAVHLEGTRCDGAAHGGCKATCLLFWKEDWLARDADRPDLENDAEDTTKAVETKLIDHTSSEIDGKKTYFCQATAAFDATEPLPWWNPSQYLEDLSSGNVGIGKMMRVTFFHSLHRLMSWGVGYRLWRWLYDTLQPRVGGFNYPYKSGRVRDGEKTPVAVLDLEPGEAVRIKSHEQILDTLDRRKCNRGMRFDEEMVPYCEKTFTVQKRVDRIIHERTGEMIEIGSPSVILDGVVCQSELSSCRLFCPRAIPSYWREIWLERATDSVDTR